MTARPVGGLGLGDQSAHERSLPSPADLDRADAQRAERLAKAE
jgi:hypothetical protein